MGTFSPHKGGCSGGCAKPLETLSECTTHHTSPETECGWGSREDRCGRVPSYTASKRDPTWWPSRNKGREEYTRDSSLGGDNEDSVLEEAVYNLRDAARRIRATQNVMHARGMTEGANYRELLTRLSTALAMTEAAYVEAAWGVH